MHDIAHLEARRRHRDHLTPDCGRGEVRKVEVADRLLAVSEEIWDAFCVLLLHGLQLQVRLRPGPSAEFLIRCHLLDVFVERHDVPGDDLIQTLVDLLPDLQLRREPGARRVDDVAFAEMISIFQNILH